MKPVPEMCYVSMCMTEKKSKMCASLNVVHLCENPIKWHGCFASSVLSRIGSIPFFWKLKLALKGRRCEFSTVQEQSSVVFIPNSGEDGGHIY